MTTSPTDTLPGFARWTSNRVTPFGRINNVTVRRVEEYRAAQEAVVGYEGVLPDGSFVAAVAEALQGRGERFFVGRGVRDSAPDWAVAFRHDSTQDQWVTYECDATLEALWRMRQPPGRDIAINRVLAEIDTTTPVGGFDTHASGSAANPATPAVPGEVSATLMALAAGWCAARITEGATEAAARTMVALRLPPAALGLLDSNTLDSNTLGSNLTS